jgi:hypothetical protein
VPTFADRGVYRKQTIHLVALHNKPVNIPQVTLSVSFTSSIKCTRNGDVVSAISVSKATYIVEPMIIIVGLINFDVYRLMKPSKFNFKKEPVVLGFSLRLQTLI